MWVEKGEDLYLDCRPQTPFSTTQKHFVNRLCFLADRTKFYINDIYWKHKKVSKGFPGGSDVRNLPAMQQMSQEDLLEKGMVTHSSLLAWRIPFSRQECTEEPGRLQSICSQRVGHDWVTNTFTFTVFSLPCLLYNLCITIQRASVETGFMRINLSIPLRVLAHVWMKLVHFKCFFRERPWNNSELGIN